MKQVPIEQLVKEEKIWFCPIAFTQIYSEMGGQFSACCFGKQSEKHSVENTSLEEWNNSDYMNSIRADMINPDSDFSAVEDKCIRCREDERRYGRSRRVESLNIYKNKPEMWPLIVKQAELFRLSGGCDMTHRMFEIQLKVFGSQCNLDCHICTSANSSTRETSQRNIIATDKVFGPLDEEFLSWVKKDRTEYIMDEVIKLAPYIKYLKIIGGEPLIMKKHYQMLDKLVESGHSKYIQLKYQTNLSETKAGQHNFFKYIPEFESVIAAVSIDGVGEVNDWLRRRSDWDKIMWNCDEVRKYPNAEVNYNGTIGFFGAMRFYEVIDHCIENGVRINYAMLENQVNLKTNNLPQPIKDKLIPIYQERANINPVYNDIINALKLPQDEDFNMENLIEYINAVDSHYGEPGRVLELFPDLIPYWHE